MAIIKTNSETWGSLNKGKRVYLNNPEGYPRYAGTVRGHFEAFKGSGVYYDWADIDWDHKSHPCTNPIEIQHLRFVSEEQ